MKHIFILGVFIGLFASCASVRVVKSRPGVGGVIAVKQGFVGDSAEVMAKRVMKRNCPRGFRVYEEGEFVVGKYTRTSGREKTKGSMLDKSSNKKFSSSSEESNKTEWRMKYKCKRKRSRR